MGYLRRLAKAVNGRRRARLLAGFTVDAQRRARDRWVADNVRDGWG